MKILNYKKLIWNLSKGKILKVTTEIIRYYYN